MPYLTKIKGANFAAIRSAIVTQSTTLTDQLNAYYRLGGSLQSSLLNYANNTYDATPVGNPTATELHLEVNSDNRVVFPTQPTTGDRTIAIILQGRNNGGVANYPIGVWSGSPSSNGAEYIQQNDLNVTYQATAFDPITGQYVDNINLLTPITLIEGRYDMIVVRLQDQVGGDMFRPRDAIVRSDPNNNTTVFPSPASYSLAAISSTAQANVAMFAQWSKALSDAEIQQFYAEQQNVFSSHGI